MYKNNHIFNCDELMGVIVDCQVSWTEAIKLCGDIVAIARGISSEK